MMGSNPASRVPMPNPNNERDRVLREEEWGKLYQAAKPHLKSVLLLAYQLGQRMSEIVCLTWDRVDLKQGFIMLRAIDTKTKKSRQVPLTPRCQGDPATAREGPQPCNQTGLPLPRSTAGRFPHGI